MPVRSMVAPLRRVAVRPPSPTSDFGSALWAEPVDVALLGEQHQSFCALVRSLGSEVVELPPQPDLPDSCFVYDPVFVTGRGGVQLRSSKANRVKESPVLAAELAAAGIPTIAVLTGGATADGGDMFWLDEHTLAVGRSYRTNQLAVDQLRVILQEEDARVEVFDVPHDHGPDFCLHLMSVISPVRQDLAVVYEPLAPVALLQALASRGVTILPLPADDYPSLGGNILAVEPGVVVLADGNQATVDLLMAHGVVVHTYAASEINKGEGGPTCLTRPMDRS